MHIGQVKLRASLLLAVVGAVAVGSVSAVAGEGSASTNPGEERMAGASASDIDTKGPTASPNDFDFMVGEWDADVVRFAPDGSVQQEQVGRWSAQSLFDDRMIEDRFVALADGRFVSAAVTLRTYSPATSQWEMVFLWAEQPVPNMKNFVGRRVGGEMHLTAQQVTPDGKVVENRIRFFDITKDGFSWEHRSSVDRGETWRVNTSIEARRRVDG